jgi:putative ABC transport system substrate-binding protein
VSIKWLSWKNFDATVLLKAKTWRSNGQYGLHFDVIPQNAVELVKAQVDVIATGVEEAIRAAQQATKTIPIVALVDDLLGSGQVKSLARPDGNTTGVNVPGVGLDGKRQDILIEAVPGIRRLAALADVNNTAAKLDALQKAALDLCHRQRRGDRSRHR